MTTARGMPARRVPPGISPAPYARHCGGLGWCGTLIANGEAFPESAVHGPSFPAAAILPCRLQYLPASSRLHSGDAPGLSVRFFAARRQCESRKRIARETRYLHHFAHKKMRAPHCDARSVTWMSRFLGPRCAFITSKKMMKASRNYRAESGGTGRCSGPVYQESGRISRLSAPCSITCADQPVMRDATKIGVKSGISKPIR